MKTLTIIALIAALASPALAQTTPVSALPPGLEESIKVNQQAAFAYGFMTGQRKLGLQLLGIQVPECKDQMSLTDLQACTKATNEKFEAVIATIKSYQTPAPAPVKVAPAPMKEAPKK